MQYSASSFNTETDSSKSFTNKHKTVIENGVFIGSGSQLVAPVTIGAGSTVGAGSTITDNVHADSLAVSRAPQKSIPEWVKRKKSIKNK